MPDQPAILEPFEAGPPPERKGLQNMKQWHEMVIDFMLLNPTATHQEIADQFGVAKETIGYVLRSDMFKMRLEERRARFQAQVDGTAIERLQGKLAGLAERSLDALDEKIAEQRKELGIGETRETAEMALKALGYGAPQKSNSGGTVINVLVSRDDLARARELMSPVAQPALPKSGE